MNLVILSGNVGTDPELRSTQNGRSMARFRLAVDRTQERDGERTKTAEWFTVVAWDRLAETCGAYLRKGRKVLVQGRLQRRSWEGQDGQRRQDVEVVASAVEFLDRARDGETAPAGDEEFSEEFEFE